MGGWFYLENNATLSAQPLGFGWGWPTGLGPSVAITLSVIRNLKVKHESKLNEFALIYQQIVVY